MIITPEVKNVVALNCFPPGCKEAVQRQVDYIRSQSALKNGPKRVLILGASSGFGLASRIAAFGAGADTLGVSFERGPSEDRSGSAGWYNNLYFREIAEEHGLYAKNLVGDAFSVSMREQVLSTIKADFGGKVDLVVYSLATGVRPDPESGNLIRSVIKSVGIPYTGLTLNIEKEQLEAVTLEPATLQEIDNTIKVMGGEDWADWIELLNRHDMLADGFKTVAYSYIGPESTQAIYHKGTLGHAKKDLQYHAEMMHEWLRPLGGDAWVTVCKALVTKASVFIPGLSPYVMALFKVTKAMGLHEGCIEQMYRLFFTHLYALNGPSLDAERMIRMDDWELRDDVQSQVNQLLEKITPDNFKDLVDYQGLRQDFMQLNGFGFDNIDYEKSK
ncbi:enoyl-ACP reductase FabV [Endozoicomonas elysicola]|uniref:Enoyl-[acyl-carrier-protein] reductase [NADH] n=1 Tax=Endozoicomonas elysicola TaxID=305900 RepID=A0A081KFA0_9GAMM|nr:enoyl-ACP reductase FabV [Endozoicomonas elysicola]KEI72826.1 trans-2-enoyl-CoA reductase [Endozoicomonas elysicola]